MQALLQSFNVVYNQTCAIILDSLDMILGCNCASTTFYEVFKPNTVQVKQINNGQMQQLWNVNYDYCAKKAQWPLIKINLLGFKFLLQL